MGSCPASNTMYYNVSSGGREEKRENKKQERKWKIKKIERRVVKLQR